jgi:hypothetical protein
MIRYVVALFVLSVVRFYDVHADTLTLIHVENEYVEAQMPTQWSFQVVGGKDGEMQMSVWIPYDETSHNLFLFAYWGALDPHNYLNNAYAVEYSIGDKQYYHETNGAVSMIVNGERYGVYIDIPDTIPEPLKSVILTVMNTIQAK